MIVKAVEFKKLDKDGVFEFLSGHPKTQVFSLKCFKGKNHLIHSVNQTLKAFSSKTNISSKEEIEFLLRLTANRQINKALKQAEPSKRSVFVSWSNNAEKVFEEFKKTFKFKVIPLPSVPFEEELKAIEDSAVFWLS